MQHACSDITIAAQSSLDIQQATEVATDDGSGMGVRDVPAFVVGHACRQFTIFDRKGAAKTATSG